MDAISLDQDCPLPGDELIPDAKRQISRSLTIAARPDDLWPFVVQMVLEANHGGSVLRSEPGRVLVLGALYDHHAARHLPFDAPRPAEYWQATWVLALSPLGGGRTRLDVRSRVAFAGDSLRWAAVWMHPFHDFMAPEQLRRIQRAAEGSRPRERGALHLLLDRVTPYLRRARSRNASTHRASSPPIHGADAL